ncbi:hypothetical protein [Kitasatospora paranensis]|uniref:hypothetical protein n=1 Tax=Kitasatospora paranensis TaxID=258053 RepID=UPI0031EB5FF4
MRFSRPGTVPRPSRWDWKNVVASAVRPPKTVEDAPMVKVGEVPAAAPPTSIR